jgi:prepilin-type N-terminal cleavage/methylation domain-containing protein
MPRCRGFTLVEITVALALMLVVTAGVYRVLIFTQRSSRVQLVQLNLQSNVRTAVLVTANELRGLSTVTGGSSAKNDILVPTPSGLTYRAARGVGLLCQAGTAGQLRISRGSFSGYRDPQPGRDVAYLFLEGSSTDATDDAWAPLILRDVSTGSLCPGTFEPAIAITTVAPPEPVDAPAGTPIRIYELMELRLYQSDGQWWLGARSVSAGEAIQPLAGPLSGSDGFHLEYLSATGLATTDPTAVASIRITVRGSNADLLRAGHAEGVEEELTAQVALRNVPAR